MLTASDLRWMEEHRRRAALRRMPGPGDGPDDGPDDGPGAAGLHRREVEEILAETEGGHLCARLADRPDVAHRLGCLR